MGWSWPLSSGGSKQDVLLESTAATAATSNPENSTVALSDEQRMRIFGKPGPAASQTRDQRADSELDAFLRSFNATEGDADSTEPSSPPEPIKSHAESRQLPSGDLDISPDAIYPRTMSCRQQFDQAFYCQSLGGKFNDIYRYGHLKSCSEQWGAFWFCMRTRTLPEREKEEAVKEFYRNRDEKRRDDFGSSEDVWRIREIAVKKAFWRDPHADDEGEVVKE
ncbi:hypothetical protein DOTSEDRAFT_85904 [Dothistroma septosporum NZE10]|uniref:Early meiotic induction protein 1 n=1 Tax=Dothistroma septosporum (strain NZE10 / CBS 128990) TaxID=675120 RepID=N1PVA8_DOTSN|nr:hypothetical protein DOTSEDRAFT_85904 [Dothistroma septosporum NZE10]